MATRICRIRKSPPVKKTITIVDLLCVCVWQQFTLPSVMVSQSFSHLCLLVENKLRRTVSNRSSGNCSSFEVRASRGEDGRQTNEQAGDPKCGIAECQSYDWRCTPVKRNRETIFSFEDGITNNEQLSLVDGTFGIDDRKRQQRGLLNQTHLLNDD